MPNKLKFAACALALAAAGVCLAAGLDARLRVPSAMSAPSKPYDAEVEWLEGDGVAWVDLGVEAPAVEVNKQSFGSSKNLVERYAVAV